MAVDMRELVADLTAETRALVTILKPLDDASFDRPTPAAGWAIRDQVSHLAYFDEAAIAAASDPERFRAEAAGLMARGAGSTDEIARRYHAMPPPELLAWFRDARARFVSVFGSLDAKTRLPWYGPDMSAASSVTARLMETWAHGQDVADALGVRREPTARLRHIAHLGVSTLGFAFALNGRPVPQRPVRVELTAPDGGTWAWGPEDAADVVAGTALDFCLVVTQRRNIADTALRATGPLAAEWMGIAQAFAGLPGPGRPPGLFTPQEAGDRPGAAREEIA
ncbi:MAG: TIGR03084 family metal-binding protein [Micromonosporaceae bacterium]